MKTSCSFLPLFILLSFVGCFNENHEINAPGLKGVGDFQIGKTKAEIIPLSNEWSNDYYNLPGYCKITARTPLFENTISIFCTFIRDTLVEVAIGKPESHTIWEALVAKYGEGVKTGTEFDFKEEWFGEDVKAKYEYFSDRNPDRYKRRTKEVVTFSPIGRDIWKEYNQIKTNYEEEKDIKRKEMLKESGVV